MEKLINSSHTSLSLQMNRVGRNGYLNGVSTTLNTQDSADTLSSHACTSILITIRHPND